MLISLITGDVKLDRLVKVISASSKKLHFPPFVISKYLGVILFRVHKYTVLHKRQPTDFSKRQWILSATIITAAFANGNFLCPLIHYWNLF